MKPLALALACSFATAALAQVAQPPLTPVPTPYAVVDKGANHRIWQRVTWAPDPFGSFTPVTNSFTELQTAMAHLVNGEWVNSSPQIQITASGAQATGSQHTVAFLGNINTAGSVSLTTPEGKRLASNILGISFLDASTGNSVWIGETTDSFGELLPTGDRALYQNAFDGVEADVLYVNSVSKFEQLVIFRQQLPSPTLWSMNPETTWLQVITEFAANTPSPAVTQTQPGSAVDDHIDFGIMKMAPGAAFAIGSETNRVRVTKRWVELSGRICLVEQLPLQAIQPFLRHLPPPPGTASLQTSPHSLLHKLLASSPSALHPALGDPPSRPRAPHLTFSAPLAIPLPRLAGTRTSSLALATSFPKSTGFVLDYSLVTTQTNMTFLSDMTYLVTSAVNLSGTTICEGGSVVKLSSNPTNYPAINLYGSFDCSRCRPYKICVFTSSDDNTAGETISGSSGVPALLPNTIYISANSGGTAGRDWHLNYLRMSYAVAGFVAYDGLDVLARNCQFFDCTYGLAALPGNAAAENVLFAQCAYPLYTDFYGRALNVTADGCTNFCQSEAGLLGLALTNCLVTAAGGWIGEDTPTTNPPAPILDHTVSLPSAAGVFKTVGAASYYLADQSPYRNAGTTSIDAALLADLQQKTTYPPLVYSNATISGDMVFAPQAQRDTDQPDLGVHYEPLDHVFGGCTANGNLTFQPGTAAAWFRTTSGWTHAGQGIHMADTKFANFNGAATAPAWWVRYNTVQEQSKTNWSGGYGPGGITGWALYLTNSPEIHANFLHCSVLAGEGGSGNHFRDDNGYLLVRASNSEFNSGSLGGYVCSQFLTNCLFDRVSLWLAGGQTNTSWTFRNCTHHGGGFSISRYANPTPVSARDSAFDATAVSTADQYSSNTNLTDYDYNAFISATTNRTTPNGPHDVIATSGFNWQTSWFGNYYLPTNSSLINTGWVTADVAGLYHFTTQTNQLIEGSSRVDIAYHYVATDANGNPLDDNGDGIPDYISDPNGNGLVDSGEIGWNIVGDLGLKVIITRPNKNSSIP